MKLLLAYSLGAGGLLAMQSGSFELADQMLDRNLDKSMENGLRLAENAVGSGLDGISMTLLVGAFVPVLYRIVQIAGDAFQKEHKLSVDKRRKRDGLGPDV
jgi:hypothetical protein